MLRILTSKMMRTMIHLMRKDARCMSLQSPGFLRKVRSHERFIAHSSLNIKVVNWSCCHRPPFTLSPLFVWHLPLFRLYLSFLTILAPFPPFAWPRRSKAFRHNLTLIISGSSSPSVLPRWEGRRCSPKEERVLLQRDALSNSLSNAHDYSYHNHPDNNTFMKVIHVMINDNEWQW